MHLYSFYIVLFYIYLFCCNRRQLPLLVYFSIPQYCNFNSSFALSLSTFLSFSFPLFPILKSGANFQVLFIFPSITLCNKTSSLVKLVSYLLRNLVLPKFWSVADYQSAILIEKFSNFILKFISFEYTFSNINRHIRVNFFIQILQSSV